MWKNSDTDPLLETLFVSRSKFFEARMTSLVLFFRLSMLVAHIFQNMMKVGRKDRTRHGGKLRVYTAYFWKPRTLDQPTGRGILIIGLSGIFQRKLLKTKFLTGLLILTMMMLILSAHANTAVGKNVDITANSDSAERQQVEPTIAVDPRNPDIVVAGAQDYRLLAVGEHRWLGYYRSTDGGKSWSVSLVPGFPGDNSGQGLASPLHGSLATSDPVLAFDRSGNVYYVGITTSFVPFLVKYVNDGADYAGTIIVSGLGFADKPWIGVDTTGGPNNGNVYIACDCAIQNGVNRVSGPTGLIVVRSTDGGKTFSNPVVVSGFMSFPGVAVDPSGNVFVSGVLSTNSGFTEIDVAKSTDGGLGFGKPVTAAPGIGFLPSVLPGNLFRTGTFPQIAADGIGVYMVWDDFRTNTANVLFTRSLDEGSTWSSALRVNDSPTGQHFFSSVAVSPGVVSVVWYDSRFGQLANGTITGLNLFYAQSTDAGASFSANLKVTSVSFNPNLVERADFGDTAPFMGDYIQVAASPGVAHPIWADNRDACSNIVQTFGCTNQDVFTATIIF